MPSNLETKKLTADAGVAGSYPILVGLDLDKEIADIVSREGTNRRIALITDSVVAKLHGARVVAMLKKSGLPVELFTFTHSESNKNQKTVTKLINELLKKRYGRDTFIIALGGGVVGDVAGFVASIYLRGVPYINIPTTLLAMVDSSIGGKVGIDTEYGKNTIGSFYLPKAVIMDLRFLEKMPRAGTVNGLMEAIKTFFTSYAEGVPLCLTLDLDAPLKTASTLQEIIFSSVRIKVGVTERDPRESNERKIVNFGHTIGHAVELLSGYKMPHGYAVGYGMLVETKIAELLGVLSPQVCGEVWSALAQLGITPAPLKKFAVKKIIDTTKVDKKTRAGIPHYILLKSIGSVDVSGGQYAHSVKDEIVAQALELARV